MKLARRWRFGVSQPQPHPGDLACCRHCGGSWFFLRRAEFWCKACRERLGGWTSWRPAFDTRHLEDISWDWRNAA